MIIILTKFSSRFVNFRIFKISYCIYIILSRRVTQCDRRLEYATYIAMNAVHKNIY